MQTAGKTLEYDQLIACQPDVRAIVEQRKYV